MSLDNVEQLRQGARMDTDRPRRPRKDDTLGFRINPDLKRAVEVAAVADGLSVGQWAERVFLLALENAKR